MTGNGTLRRLLNGLAGGLILAALVWAGSPSSHGLIEKKLPGERKNSDLQAAPKSEAPQVAGTANAVEGLEKIRKFLKESRYKEAEGAARTLLAEIEAVSGRDSLPAAEVLNLLVEALWQGGKASEPGARELGERALAIREKILGTDHPLVAVSLNTLAILLANAGDYTGARPFFERALTIREKTLGPDHLEVAKSLHNLATLSGVTGDYAGARPLLERALAIREKTLGPDHPLVASTLNNLSLVLRHMADYTGARPLLERALTIGEKALGPDHPEVAGRLHNLATLLDVTGDYTGAKLLQERSLAILERALGPDHPAVASILGDLAILLTTMADYAGARPLLERALAIREKALAPDHPAVATSLSNLADLLWKTGDYTGAKAFYERAVKIHKKALGPDHRYVAAGLGKLANVLTDMGDYAGATPLYEQALAIREKTLGPDHPDVATSLNNLGRLFMYMGDYAGARPLYEQALAIREKSLGPDHPDMAPTLVNLANLLRDTGDYATATPLYGRALAIHEKALGPEHPQLAWTLNNLAELHAKVGDTKEALQVVLRAEKITRGNFQLTARTLAERQALAYASVRSSGLDLALALTTEGSDEIPESTRAVWDAASLDELAASRGAVFDALIRARALVLDEMAARHRTVGRAADPEIAHLAQQLASARERLANLVVRGPGDEPPEHYRNLLDHARQEKEQAERVLAEKSVEFRQELAKSRLGLEEVAAALPPDSALAAFARYDRHELTQQRTAGKPPEPVPYYLAFVLRSGESEPAVVPLGEAEEIENLVSRLRQQIAQEAMAPGRSPKRSEAAYRRVGTTLRRKVWDPLASHLQGAKRVFVVPDGALHLVNLASLPVGRTEYLIETGRLIHYLSAERDLVGFGKQDAKGKGLLALGDPAFNETKLFASLRPEREGAEESAPVQIAAMHSFRGKRSACGEFQTLRFQPLPASAREAEEVVALWKKGTGVRQGEEHRLRSTIQERASGIVLLSGAAANEAAFKAEAPGKRVLHLATHGFFLGGRCPSALEPSGKPTQGVQPRSVTGENPLLLAGLALAGANHRQAAGPDEEDGILTAEEIAALDLSGVEWAVLSACDTGVGEVKAGEGVFGLRRAFQVAGARTLIMSLWQVEDEAVRQWMTTLYRRRFVDGLSTAESVHEASLEVLRQRRTEKKSTHPFYWAGFVAAGDWR